MLNKKPLVLCILDGWGVSGSDKWNAISQGDTPVLDQLNAEKPYVPITASGDGVGLPAGQMGNSEVGHLNIGAGRVVYQDLLRISRSIEDGSFYENQALTSAFERAVKNGSALHLLGLLSDGGVHSHIDHLIAFIKLAKRHGLAKVYIHPFMDGRDTPPDSGLNYIKKLEKELADIGTGKIATVQGRFWAMDRDTRWERVEKAHRLLTLGEGQRFHSAAEAVQYSYEKEVTDEFIEPSFIEENGEPVGSINDGDEVIMFNFRADRMREIVRTLFDPDFHEIKRGSEPKVNVTCLTEYDASFGLPVAYESTVPKNGLGQILSEHGLAQLRTAETEKYAHVTFFFQWRSGATQTMVRPGSLSHRQGSAHTT